MNSLNRRDFIKSSSALMSLASFGLLGMDFKDQEGPLKVALIGTGWYGKSDLFRLIQVADVEVVGLCDVDSKQLAEAGRLVSTRQKSGKVPALYEDYKKLLENEKPEYVLVGTPDHWHALIAIDSLKIGAHVYLQKPISVDVIEGEAILAAARKYDRKVQIGTQRRSTPHLVQAKKEIIDSGKLGKISHAEVCCYYHMRNRSHPDVMPVPENINYDLWAGPAPKLPYRGILHRGWRAFMEYGNGIVGDMCVHMLDAVRWMLDLGWPVQVTSTGGIYMDKASISNISDTQTAIFEFDEINVVWQHRTWGNPVDKDYPWAFKIYGENGTLAGSPMRADFYPEGRDNGDPIHYPVVLEKEQYPEDVTEKDIEIHAAPATRQQMKDWLKAIESDSLPVADVLQGHISTASCILANMSMELGGRSLKYDPKTMSIIGDEEATALLKRPYRDGYVHPDPNNI